MYWNVPVMGIHQRICLEYQPVVVCEKGTYRNLTWTHLFLKFRVPSRQLVKNIAREVFETRSRERS